MTIFLILLTFTNAAAAAQPVSDHMDIDATINSGYAITTVEEKLTNPTNEPVNDKFEFMIPEEAFISGFSIIVDGKEYKADVLASEEASERFEDAASQGRTAGLLETEDSNVFAYALSFEPRQSITVRLTYEQALKKNLGEYEYIQPLRSSHDVNKLSANVSITSMNRILSIETPGFTDTQIEYLSTKSAQVTYSADSLPGSDLRVIFATENPPLSGNMLFYEMDGQGYMMHVFSPSEEDLGTTAMNKDIVFVIDKSGSMYGQKIEQVKRVFTDIISGLPGNDNFNVIFFDSSVHTYSSSLMEADAAADTAAKADAIEFVSDLEANGDTNINSALIKALRMFDPESERVPIIVFLTDGEPTTGVVSPYVIRENVKEENKADVSIFTIAFGIENERYYDFLRAMSLENSGKAERFYLSANSEKGMSDFYDTISTPLITDMEFVYDEQVTEVVNTAERNLFAGSDAIMLGMYDPDTDMVSCSIKTNTRTGKQSFNSQFLVITEEENIFVPRLWAYTTINDLLERIEVEGESEELVAQVTDLSLEFGFVTPYTSLFVEIPDTSRASEEDIVTEEPVDEVEAMVPEEEASAVEEPMVEEPTDSVEYEYEENLVDEEEPMDAAEEPAAPGFEVMYSIAGILAVTYLLLRRKN